MLVLEDVVEPLGKRLDIERGPHPARYVHDVEAVFLFEADAREAVERLADDAGLWEAAEGWTEIVAGPPRLAGEAYSWARPHPPDETFFTPTPGPGDSEGGDIYEPKAPK